LYFGIFDLMNKMNLIFVTRQSGISRINLTWQILIGQNLFSNFQKEIPDHPYGNPDYPYGNQVI